MTVAREGVTEAVARLCVGKVDRVSILLTVGFIPSISHAHFWLRREDDESAIR